MKGWVNPITPSDFEYGNFRLVSRERSLIVQEKLALGGGVYFKGEDTYFTYNIVTD